MTDCILQDGGAISEADAILWIYREGGRIWLQGEKFKVEPPGLIARAPQVKEALVRGRTTAMSLIRFAETQPLSRLESKATEALEAAWSLEMARQSARLIPDDPAEASVQEDADRLTRHVTNLYAALAMVAIKTAA